MNILIQNLSSLLDNSEKAKEKLDVLTLKITETADAFKDFGLHLVPLVPPAARAEKLLSNFLIQLPEKQSSLVLVKKNHLDRCSQINKEYALAYELWLDSTNKLSLMNDKNDPRLKKRIEIQKEKVDSYKSDLDGIEAEYKNELELIVEEQTAIVKNSIVILLEIQKRTLEQCTGVLDTFRKEWDAGKRNI